MDEKSVEKVAEEFVIKSLGGELSRLLVRMGKKCNLESVSIGDFIKISGHIAAKEVVCGLKIALGDSCVNIEDARKIVKSIEKYLEDERKKVIPNWAKDIFTWAI